MPPSPERQPEPERADVPPSHPDFQISWVQNLLSAPSVEIIRELPPHWTPEIVSNNMFNLSLAHSTGLRARLLFRRKSTEPDSISNTEYVYLLSIGTGLDGASGRAHGGFASLVLDQLLGTVAHFENGQQAPPATAELTVRYLKPVRSPAVLVARAWVVKVEGRKIFVNGALEDGEGRGLASARGLFVRPRDGEGHAL